MARLKFKNAQPPGGWWYLQPDTGARIEAESLDSLCDKVADHRTHKKLTPTDSTSVTLDIERQICSRLSDRHCSREGAADDWAPIPERGLIPTLDELFAGSRAALTLLASDLNDASEADKRASICIRCPLNSPASGCKCAPLYRAIEAAVPAARRIDGLHICAACACALQAKVNLTTPALRKIGKPADVQFPTWCWQREIFVEQNP